MLNIKISSTCFGVENIHLPGRGARVVSNGLAVDVASVVVKSQHSRSGNSLHKAPPVMARSHKIVPTQNIPIHRYACFDLNYISLENVRC